MGTMTRRVAVALAAAGLLVSLGCAKDETVTSSNTTTPVTASSGGGAGTTEAPDTTEPDDEDKDKGSGDYDEACSVIEEIDQLDDDADVDEGLALFDDARDAGPEELVDHWDTLSEVFAELFALDENDDADMTRALELVEDPDFLEAAAAIDDFAEEECGIDIELDPSEESDAPGGRTGDDEIGVPSDGSEDPTSIDAVQAHLEDNYGTEDWWPVLEDASGWSATSGVDPQWTITLSSTSDWESLSTRELAAACDAIAEYLDTVEETDAAVEILDPDEAVLVNRFMRDETCSAP
jgi:hypothetical protein